MLAPGRSAWDRFGRAAMPAAVLAVTLLACLVRAAGLPAVQGTMGRDEARLALAGRAILEHGLPLLGDGFLYTRGLLPAYTNAATFALLGASDQAARLSDVVLGTLLVVAVYRLGRLAGGPRPALAAATIVAFSPPLVLQSREAWLYSSFLLWMTLALGWLVRDAPGDRIRAGLAALAALFSHELAVLLMPVALALDLGRVWHTRRAAGPFRQTLHRARGGPPPPAPPPREGEGPGEGDPRASWWRGVAVFWALLLAGTATVGILSLVLRAPTLGGPTVELREYLRPGTDLRGLSASLDILGGWHPWLLPVAVLGLPLSRGGWRALLRGRGVMPCLLMLLAVIAFNSFGLVRRGESRYMLAAIPFLAVVAAVSLDRAGPAMVAALIGRRRLGSSRHLVRVVLLTVLVAASLDPTRLLADARSRAVPDTWVQAVADRAPTDLIVSFAPTLTSHYLGRTDFWLRPNGYAKYVWAGQPPLRDVHTGATVIRSQAELDRLLLLPYRGRTVWVVLAGDPTRESSRVLREVGRQLVARAAETRRPADGRLVLRLQL